MPKKVNAYGARAKGGPMGPMTIERRDVRARDIEIEVLFCGICHSDLHKVNHEWETTNYPIVPGHEIVGRVASKGKGASRFKAGDLVGVGCFVDSCRACSECKAGREMFCRKETTWTYDSPDRFLGGRTYGGYSQRIVVDERYVLRIPQGLDPAAAAPLLCAGITTYSPLRQWGCTKGSEVAVMGLGGLGHMGVKLAKMMGAKVTVLSSTPAKERDAKRLGASKFVLTSAPDALTPLEGTFDIVLDSVSAAHPVDNYLALLKPLGAMVLVGLPPLPTSASPVDAGSLIGGNKRLAGSNIGGIKETQQMLDLCAKRGIVADVEVIRADQINAAFARMLKSDVRYRFSIDCATMGV